VPLRPEHTARARARRRWPELGCCEYPGCTSPATDRHHRDGDVWNNARANVCFLCGPHHAIEQVHTRYVRLALAGQLVLVDVPVQLRLAA
jgi:hypothetical protein